MPSAPLILIVEDEYEIRNLLAAFLDQHGYRLALANESSVGAEILRATSPALLIADVRLPGGSGEELAQLARAMDVPVILISGEPTAIARPRVSAISFLQKPFRLGELELEIRRVLSKAQKASAAGRAEPA